MSRILSTPVLAGGVAGTASVGSAGSSFGLPAGSAPWEPGCSTGDVSDAAAAAAVLPSSLPATHPAFHFTFTRSSDPTNGATSSLLSTSHPPSAALHPACSSPNARKGAVLLDCCMQPRTSWAFEAVMVLLGGHWPPRGLLSGRWPPEEGEAEEGPAAGLPLPLPLLATVSSGGASAEGSACGSSGPANSRGGGGAESSSSGVHSGSASDNKQAAVLPHAGRQLRLEQETAAAGTAPALPPRPLGGRSLSRQRQCGAAGSSMFTHVVHCGSVRQPARVELMQELCDDKGAEGSDTPRDGRGEGNGNGGDTAPAAVSRDHRVAAASELKYSASMRAAAALLQSARHGHVPMTAAAASRPAPDDGAGSCSEGPGSSSGSGSSGKHHTDPDLGCLVRVVMRFANRPEWLREGARLLVRDRGDGHVAGAGFVRAVLPT